MKLTAREWAILLKKLLPDALLCWDIPDIHVRDWSEDDLTYWVEIARDDEE